MRTPDKIFNERRLAQLYDSLHPIRSDLYVYVAMSEEFGARSVLDIGCGTGTFACMLAERGLDVTAVDPAAPSLDIARGAKPYADRIHWIHGYTNDVPNLHVDLVTMTGNVAQVFLSDEEWAHTLEAVHRRLTPGGRFIFEVRKPEAKAWLEWNREQSYEQASVPGVGDIHTWVEVTDVGKDQVSFQHIFIFSSNDEVLTSDSMLRFRSQEEVTASLHTAGFVVDEIREAPDRPGREFVFIARPIPLR